jgi:hypothetical protein
MALPSELTLQQKLGCAVGLYILQCQELERLLKGIVPLMSNEDPSVTGLMDRARALKKQSLGLVAGKFMERASGDIEDFKGYVGKIVDDRNEVVHHFSERLGPLLESGMHDELFAELRRQHTAAAAFSRALRELASAIQAALCDDPEISSGDFTKNP